MDISQPETGGPVVDVRFEKTPGEVITREPTTEELQAMEQGAVDPWFLKRENIQWALGNLDATDQERAGDLRSFLEEVQVWGGVAMHCEAGDWRLWYLAIDTLSDAEAEFLQTAKSAESRTRTTTSDHINAHLEHRERTVRRLPHALGGMALGAVGGLTPLVTAFPYWAQAGMYGVGVAGASAVAYSAKTWLQSKKNVRQQERELDDKATALTDALEAIQQKFLDSGKIIVPDTELSVDLRSISKSSDPVYREFTSVIEAHQDSVVVSQNIVDTTMQTTFGKDHKLVKKAKRKKVKELSFNPAEKLQNILKNVHNIDRNAVRQAWLYGLDGGRIEPLAKVMRDISEAYQRSVEYEHVEWAIRAIDGRDKDDVATLKNLGATRTALDRELNINLLRFLRCRQEIMRYLSSGLASQEKTWPLFNTPTPTED